MKVIYGYSDYSIRADGTVYSHKHNKDIKQFLLKSGITYVKIYSDNGSRNMVKINDLLRENYGYSQECALNLDGFVPMVDNSNYLINYIGQVYSKRTEKILSQKLTNNGYLVVTIGSPARTILVHREVLKAFDRMPESNEICNHIDANKTNNCIENLEWCTHQENMNHAKELNLFDGSKGNSNGLLSGQLNPNSKLSIKQVAEIRDRHTKRSRGETIWEEYGISKAMYYNIVNNRNWN